MHIEPPRPQVTVEGLRLLMDLMKSCEHYTKKTGRSFQEDIELIGHLEGMEDELKGNAPATFIALANTGFNLYGDHHKEEHYYQATRDYITDELEKHGLRGRWCDTCSSYEREHGTDPCTSPDGQHNYDEGDTHGA